MITSIKKRDGREIHFSPEKITRAIFLAASRVAQEEGSKADYETAEILTEKVVNLLNNTYQGTTPTVENVQDAVIKVLIETGHARTSEVLLLWLLCNGLSETGYAVTVYFLCCNRSCHVLL